MEEFAAFTGKNRINHFLSGDGAAFSKQDHTDPYGQNLFSDGNMRGDQLSRQWRILRQIETHRNGLTAAEIAKINQVSLRGLNRVSRQGF